MEEELTKLLLHYEAAVDSGKGTGYEPDRAISRTVLMRFQSIWSTIDRLAELALAHDHERRQI